MNLHLGFWSFKNLYINVNFGNNCLAAIRGYIFLAKASNMVTLGFKYRYTYCADLICHEHLWPLDTFSGVHLGGYVSVVMKGPLNVSRDTVNQPSWVQIQAL